MWLCMNPSSATNDRDDATLRKLTRHSQRLGFSGLFLLNIMDYRATDPQHLALDAERSNRNLRYISRCAARSEQIVLAFGGLRARGIWRIFAAEAVEACGDNHLRCVVCNADGSPRHPRMFPAKFALQEFR